MPRWQARWPSINGIPAYGSEAYMMKQLDGPFPGLLKSCSSERYRVSLLWVMTNRFPLASKRFAQ